MLHQNVVAIGNAVSENKLSVGNFPSVYECAALSLDVYYEKNDPERPALPDGWMRFKDSGKNLNGYFGACYIKHPENLSCILFAHRGTVLQEPGTIFSDGEVVLNQFLKKTPLQFETAKQFVMQALIEITNEYPDQEIGEVAGIHTGHSLGGILADLMATAQKLPAVTFENPGSKPIIIKMFRDRHLPEKIIQEKLEQLSRMCQAYQADVNLINTCNEQVGKTYRLANLGWNYDAYRGGPDLPILSRYIDPYYIAYTFDQHKIERFITYLNNDGQIIEEHYPVGFQQGFVAYLDGKTRKQFWDGYVSRIWAAHSDIREDFKEWQKYYDFFYWRLNQVQEEAKGELVESISNNSKNEQIEDLEEFVIIKELDKVQITENENKGIGHKRNLSRSTNLINLFQLFKLPEEEVEPKQDSKKLCRII